MYTNQEQLSSTIIYTRATDNQEVAGSTPRFALMKPWKRILDMTIAVARKITRWKYFYHIHWANVNFRAGIFESLHYANQIQNILKSNMCNNAECWKKTLFLAWTTRIAKKIIHEYCIKNGLYDTSKWRQIDIKKAFHRNIMQNAYALALKILTKLQ